MKINRLLSALLIGASIACQKDSLPIPASANPVCFEDNSVSHQAKSLKGIVGYRKDVSMYTVAYTIPKTIDSRWVGLVCNLPTSYQVIGKEVSFSGEYRRTLGKVSAQFGGDEMYYLYLSSIK
jgi:hypothetical protein